MSSSPQSFSSSARDDGSQVEPLLRLAYRLLGGVADASRCVSGVLSVPTYAEPLSKRYRVARDATRQLLSRCAGQSLTDARLLPRFDTKGNHTRPVAPWPAFESPSIGRERARACIERLPVLYRVMITLHDVEEFSLDEIGRILSIDRTQALTLRRESRQALHTLMAARFEEGASDDFH